jgi:hypothetical protein
MQGDAQAGVQRAGMRISPRDPRLFLASIAQAAALARMKDAADPGAALASASRLRSG